MIGVALNSPAGTPPLPPCPPCARTWLMIASPENSSAKAEAALRKESLENFMIREKFLKKKSCLLDSSPALLQVCRCGLIAGTPLRVDKIADVSSCCLHHALTRRLSLCVKWCVGEGIPLARLILRIVLEGGSASGKMTFVPDCLIALLIALRLEGLIRPPVAYSSMTGNSRTP